MALTLLEVATAAVSGGLGTKLLDWLYEELKSRSGDRKSASKVVDAHLDPILKAADELVGKIRSLAVSDFRELSALRSEKERLETEVLGVVFLFSQLWARFAILRRESLYVALADDSRGRQLQEFIRTLEATRVRIVSRELQRAIGDFLIVEREKPRAMMISEFYRAYDSDALLRKWLAPLFILLKSTHHTSVRQRLLGYGVVVLSLMETLDPQHRVTRERQGWGNKLSKRTRRELKYRVFENYLTFVAGCDKWLK